MEYKMSNSSPFLKKAAQWLGFVLIVFIFFGGVVNAATEDKKPSGKSARKEKKNSNKNLTKKKYKKKRKLNRKKVKQSGNYEKPQVEDEFEADGEKRRDWFLSQRVYPFDSLPADARRTGWLSRPEEARAENGLAAPMWQKIGPAPTNSYFPNNWGQTSGRINAVAVSPSNPQLILIGAATGGIWRSTDGGTNFTSVSDGHVDLAVGSVAFAPSNHSIVYAGMGDNNGGYLGTGVLKSTDGGVTWNRISSNTLPAPGRISRIAVDPNNENIVYAAQFASRTGGTLFSSGFWRSMDGGVTWTKTVSGLPTDLLIHPTQAGTLYLAMNRIDGVTPSTGGVFKSVDSGQTWTRVYTSPFASTSNIKIAVSPGAPSNLYVLVGSGSTARVEISSDEGTNWVNRGSAFDTGQFGYNCYLFVHPTNPNTIYVGTRDLWRSLDGGTSYSNITNNFTITGSYTPTISRSHPDQHHFYISNVNPNLIYIANDGGLWRSTDGAASFQSLNATLGLTMFTSLDLHPTDPARSYGGTQDNGTQKRLAGQGWREFAAGDGGQTIIDPVDPSIVYTTYVYNTIYRYQNHGDTLSAQIGNNTVFSSDRVAFYPPFVSNGVNSNLYFGTYRLWISTNRGVNWTAPAATTDLTNGGSDTLSAIGVSASNNNVIYTGSAQGRVLVSTNGGASWNGANTGLPVRFIKSIIVHPTNPNVAYLTVSGFDSGHVFKTTNGGASWADISGNLPNVPTNTLLIDPRTATTLYVGTDIGVFRSTTDGTNWETFNSGLPPTIVTELDAQAGGLMQAATYGRGAYQIDLNATGGTLFDYDGDGKADISVFRPANGGWYLLNSTAGFTSSSFGLPTDKIAPADFDGDGKTDIAVLRDGTWYLQRSQLGFTAIPFGQAGDVPVPADYDGDGKSDIAVFRQGNWYIQGSQVGFYAVAFGVATDKATPADFDGDGRTDVAVFRDGSWYIQRSQLGFTTIPFGAAGDRPVQADYDADGKADAAVYRGGSWYILGSQAGFSSVAFGTATDVPAPADFDGDGKADPSVFRNGVWYQLRSQAGFQAVSFGITGDKPTPSAFVP